MGISIRRNGPDPTTAVHRWAGMPSMSPPHMQQNHSIIASAGCQQWWVSRRQARSRFHCCQREASRGGRATSPPGSHGASAPQGVMTSRGAEIAVRVARQPRVGADRDPRVERGARRLVPVGHLRGYDLRACVVWWAAATHGNSSSATPRSTRLDQHSFRPRTRMTSRGPAAGPRRRVGRCRGGLSAQRTGCSTEGSTPLAGRLAKAWPGRSRRVG